MEVGAQHGVCRAKGTNARGQGHSTPQVLPFREPKGGSVSSGVYIADSPDARTPSHNGFKIILS